MKKIWKIIITIVIVFVIIMGVLYAIDISRMKNNKPVLFSTWGRKYIQPQEEQRNTKMNIVLSLEDTISDNTAWCGTFNLIWNDLKNDIAKQDIVFTPQLDIVENLNKGTFKAENLSENSYYKVYGHPSIELKEQIEKAIREKFNETSDILNDFNWEDRDPEDYFLYAMLKKEFEFPKVFTELENGRFGNYDNVKYFGINEETEDEVRNQVEVLYYNSKEDFAIKLVTKSNDEVIISKGNNKTTFGEMYEDIMQKSKKYEGSHTLAEGDTLKIPNISFNLKEELTELQNESFEFANGDIYKIEKAMQTIKFELDKKGGKIKSEAGMMVELANINLEESREFLVDNTFTIFLAEKGKQLPYFAAKISDISQVQEDTIMLK